MKTFTIKYQWFKVIRTAEVSAKDYIAAKVEFERTKQISRKFIMKILQQ
jgi:hypothetical protein